LKVHNFKDVYCVVITQRKRWENTIEYSRYSELQVTVTLLKFTSMSLVYITNGTAQHYNSGSDHYFSSV